MHTHIHKMNGTFVDFLLSYWSACFDVSEFFPFSLFRWSEKWEEGERENLSENEQEHSLICREVEGIWVELVEKSDQNILYVQKN